MGKFCRIIGVLVRRVAVFAWRQNRLIIAPLATLLRRFGAHQPVTIYSQQRPGALQDSVIDEVRSHMRARRKLLPAQEDTFFIITSDSALAIYKAVIGCFYLVSILMSGVALTVCGLGVTNIMLVNVRGRP